jgi:alpha-L-fucosidase
MKNKKAPATAIERFLNNRFGLFIHYGLYSVLNRREWAMYYERIPVEEYRKLADAFHPDSLDVADWVKLAKDTGMKYACFTTRHHEGFCLFDTACADFNSVKTAARRDLVREFVEACRAHDIRPTLYYSVADWSDPGYTGGSERRPAEWPRFVETVHAQLRELMTNYGEIDYLFYDGCPDPADWDAAGINAALRELQPNLLISDRCQLDEDVASSEDQVREVRMVATGERIAFTQTGDRVFLTGLPESLPGVLPVVAMELDSPPRGIPNPYQCGNDAKFVF